MKLDIRFESLELDEARNPIIYAKKRLEDFEILKTGRIRCCDCPSFYEGLENYIIKHKIEWGLKSGETVGYLMKSKRQGYNIAGDTFKTVVFYRIKDDLD